MADSNVSTVTSTVATDAKNEVNSVVSHNKSLFEKVGFWAIVVLVVVVVAEVAYLYF